MCTIRITKQFKFEACHALYGYDGKCKNIHGHSYKLWVTVIGKPIAERTDVKYGMVIDFADLKKIVREEIIDEFDHSCILDKTSPHEFLATQMKNEKHNIIQVEYQPTSENMINDFAQRIMKRLDKNVSLYSLKLQETDSSYAEWFASDNK